MTTNIELLDLVNKLKIPNFKQIIMRDEFNNLDKPLENESGIYNLGDHKTIGTHWCSWYKNKNNWYHFDSFGIDPCMEFRKYCNLNEVQLKRSFSPKIHSHSFQIQDLKDINCGEWCILFLYLMNKEIKYEKVISFMTAR